MHYIGYLIYSLVIIAIVFIPAANTLVVTSFNLAPEITLGCLVVASYPPLQFLYYHLRGFKEKIHFERMCSVSQTCGNTVVSLGLIGTFVGLTAMIEKIAGAIGGEGGSLDEQIAIIMTAIGESLDAMSFAFLTSVMGVAASVIIFASSVYFKMFFDQAGANDDDNVSDEAMDARLKEMEGESVKIRHYISRMISGNIDRKEMASIVVSNSLQLKALNETSARLESSITSQVEINQSVNKAIDELTVKMDKILENQNTLMKFESGSYEELTKIRNSAESLNSAKNQSDTRMKKALGAISDGLKGLNH